MEIYFLRHGQTKGNVEKRHQPEDSQLTIIGDQQARDVAKVIKDLHPTHLLTSNMVRAIETTKYVADECNLVPKTSANFVELIRPGHLYGHFHSSLPSVWFYLKWYFGLSKGGESYLELRKRFKLAEAELATYPADSKLVVVSHAVFISLLLAHLCNEKALWSRKLFAACKAMLSMTNTQIIKVNLDPTANENTCAWTVEQGT